ncbi:MAG: class I SAM-dependent methyltransferase [Balneolaceae bacterium]|nr:class I SAM-dependent methyltransferase [Balneolaceae bacterium]
MSRIAYDPVKDRFARIIRSSRLLRTLFYKILDLFFLRSWYIRRVLRREGGRLDGEGPWTLLDAGSGFGQYDRFILREFDRVLVTAVDVKEDYLEDARRYFRREIRRGRITLNQADLLKLNSPDAYDFVLCVDVLEHIEEDVRVMRNIAGALKEDGLFLMHSPSIYSEEDAEGEESFVDEHARTGYSEEDLRVKLREAGLEPVEISYTYGRKGHRAWEWIIKYPMLWMTRWRLWALPFMAVWYLFVLPPALLLMRQDMEEEKEWGTGIYALARKG